MEQWGIPGLHPDTEEASSPGLQVTGKLIIREKAFREMKKDVGIKKVRKQEGWKWDQSLFCISSRDDHCSKK